MRPKFRLRPLVALLVPVSVAVPLGGAFAQSLDPRLLQNLQSQLGVPESVQQGVSQSQTTPAPSSGEVSLPGSRVDTLEEQEVRRAEARQQLREIYQPVAQRDAA